MAEHAVAKSEQDWEVESASDTLMKAEEIKNNPALHKKAMAKMEERHQAMMKVLGPNRVEGLGKVKIKKVGNTYQSHRS